MIFSFNINKCEVCRKKKFFIKKRVFKAPKVGKITSQSLMCRKCAKGLQATLDKTGRS